MLNYVLFNERCGSCLDWYGTSMQGNFNCLYIIADKINCTVIDDFYSVTKVLSHGS